MDCGTFTFTVRLIKHASRWLFLLRFFGVFSVVFSRTITFDRSFRIYAKYQNCDADDSAMNRLRTVAGRESAKYRMNGHEALGITASCYQRLSSQLSRDRYRHLVLVAYVYRTRGLSSTFGP